MNALIKAGIVLLVVAGGAEWALRRDDTTSMASARGEHLFLTKGCVTCHVQSGVDSARTASLNRDLSGNTNGTQPWDAATGPDLTHYTNDPAFLRRWLDRPSAVRADAEMPDLDLSSAEIEELIAFINRERK